MASLTPSSLAVVSAVIALVLSGGCDGGSTGPVPPSSGKPVVVATTTMIGDLVRRIGGDRVEVKVIMGPGVDPHTYKPAPSDMAELKAATLIFYNGLHLEGKMV